jgi:DNA-binding protein WhiA
MFLTAGSISDPNKFYHFEIVCANEDKATQLQGIINSFDLGAKLVKRKKNYVVYVKEGSQIVELLNIMEAHVSLMNLENIRIVKGVKNNVNRQVNCETANLNKVVAAAVKQTEDIRYIEQTVGLDSLDESLEELARVRLEHSDTPLKDLGQYLSQPLGKSGVNHRLKKISEIAEKIRNDRKESL